MKKCLPTVSAVVALTLSLLPLSGLHAETLREAVIQVLETHDRILAAKADLSASDSRVHESFANSWAPRFDLLTHLGREVKGQKVPGTNTTAVSREVDLTLTQRIWDGGLATANLNVAKETRSQMKAGLDVAGQAMILDSVSAYINLRRAKQMVGYAEQSIENIRRQSEVEDARVALGKGYSTDVLQVKTQLAGAEARLVQAKGALLLAKNHIRTVYLREPDEIAALEAPKPNMEILPKTVDEAVAQTIASNPSGRQLAHMADMLDHQVTSTIKTTFIPTVNAIFSHKSKQNVSGVLEFERETFAKVEASYSFNLGLSSLETIDAARRDAEAARRRHRDLLLQISEQTRSAWDNLETARANADLLTIQADLAEKFLELAREERKLGQRTLLDVLNGETSLINARSDAASAEADVEVAYYTLIQTMGILTPDLLTIQGNLAGNHTP